MATLRTAALNLLYLAEFRSIRSDLQAVMGDITALLAMVRGQPQPDAFGGFESALHQPLYGSIPLLSIAGLHNSDQGL